MRKKARDDKERKDYEAGKKQEVNQHFQAKLQQAQAQLDKRSKSLNLKMKRAEKKQAELALVMEEFKNEKQEQNNQKNDGHQRSLQKIQKER